MSFQLSSPPAAQQLHFHDSSPFLRRSSLTSSLGDYEDDGFLEVLDDDVEVSLSGEEKKKRHSGKDP